MQINEIMTREVELAGPDDTLQKAAKMMADLDAGALPVAENDRLVGVVTDRDIALRGAAAGLDPKTATLRQVMTGPIRYCFEDEAIEEVGRKMSGWQVRRLPVMSRVKRLVGIISLGDIAVGAPEHDAAKEALCGISQPAAQQAEPAYAAAKPGGSES